MPAGARESSARCWPRSGARTHWAHAGAARQNVWTVVAVLRALPALARQLVMRLAYLDAPADVSQWVAKPAAGAPSRSLARGARARAALHAARRDLRPWHSHAQVGVAFAVR